MTIEGGLGHSAPSPLTHVTLGSNSGYRVRQVDNDSNIIIIIINLSDTMARILAEWHVSHQYIFEQQC